MRSNSVISAFGDSFTAGNGSNGYNSFANIVSARYGCTLSNFAVGGTGVSRAVTNAFTCLATGAAPTKNVILMAGFNDMSRYVGQQTLDKIEHETTAFIANALLAFAIPASSSAVVNTGSWNSATPGAWKDKASAGLSGTAMFHYGAGGAKSWSFSGDTVVIGTWDTDGSVYQLSPIEVRIDGVLIDTYHPQGATDGNAGCAEFYPGEVFMGLSHHALVYTELGAGPHTVEVRSTENGYIFIDYFGCLGAPGSAPLISIADAPKLNDAGYALLPLRSSALDDQASAVIASVVDRFAKWGYPVQLIKVNDFYDPSTGADSDHVHPSVIGHKQISRAYS